jgi:leucyl/phenylalanyl-tRNA--protein transferase
VPTPLTSCSATAQAPKRRHAPTNAHKKLTVFTRAIIGYLPAMATIIPSKQLLGMYAAGWFPMACEDGEIRLFSPDPRGILPLDGFRIPHGAKKTLADPAWEVRWDSAFETVMRGCGDRKETWIDDIILSSYVNLHREGRAHSVEVWREGELAGGLYGVRLGAAFFGESMFHRVPGASKVALVALVNELKLLGFQLLDIQWVTPHLRLFGATEIPRHEYLGQLEIALRRQTDWPQSKISR